MYSWSLKKVDIGRFVFIWKFKCVNIALFWEIVCSAIPCPQFTINFHAVFVMQQCQFHVGNNWKHILLEMLKDLPMAGSCLDKKSVEFWLPNILMLTLINIPGFVGRFWSWLCKINAYKINQSLHTFKPGKNLCKFIA